MKLKQEGYRLSNIPVIEVIGSILIFATIFLPWMRVNLGLGISESLRFSDKTIYIVVFGVACFANVALKFFRRSTWASLPITLCGIELLVWVSRVYFGVLSMKEESGEITMMESMIGKKILTLDIGYYLALFTSVVMLICIIRGWLTYLHDKAMRMPYESYKKQQTIAFISLLATVALAYLTKEIVVDIDCTVDSGWEAYDVIIKNIEALIPVILAHITAFLFSHYLLLAMMILDKHKDGKNVTEDNITENEGISDVQHQTEEKTVETPVSPAHVEEPQEEMSDIEHDDNDEVDDSRKKWYYIGGAVAAAVIAVSCFFAFSGGSGNDNNPLGVQKPKWEKFIKVNTSDVKLYKEASTDSPVLQEAIENIDSDMAGNILMWQSDKKPRGYNVDDYCVMENTIYPVIDENDEWYRVHIGNREITEAYIQKIHCEEVKPEPITKKIIDKVKTDNWTTHKLVEKGEFANLYLERYFNEMGGGETVITGVLIDGCIVVPDECSFRPCKKDTIGTDIYNSVNSSDYNDWWMNCPKEYWKASPEVGDGIFDANKLTDSDIQKIVLAMRPQGNTASKVYYYFPTVATDRFIEFQYSFSPAAAVVEEGETNVTGYEVKQEGEQWRLYAKYGEKIEDTGLSFYEDLNVHAVKDFDGDGNVDAVVSEIMSGGNDDSIYHPFIVFYDNESGTFKKTKQMDYYGADPIVEDWNNMCTVCQSEGLRKVRYALKDGELTIVEDWMKSVGNVLHTIKMSELFGDDENADKVIEIDFDNDGENEKLTFHHGVSHAEYYGAKMNLMGVEWSDGRTLEMCINADIFKILEETTNGMPDIIADEWLWRWNGSEYDYYGWDGNNLVKH